VPGVYTRIPTIHKVPCVSKAPGDAIVSPRPLGVPLVSAAAAGHHSASRPAKRGGVVGMMSMISCNCSTLCASRRELPVRTAAAASDSTSAPRRRPAASRCALTYPPFCASFSRRCAPSEQPLHPARPQYFVLGFSLDLAAGCRAATQLAAGCRAATQLAACNVLTRSPDACKNDERS